MSKTEKVEKVVKKESHVNSKDLDEELSREEKRDVIKQRKYLSKFMRWFLVAQYVTIIILLLFQGFNLWGFSLKDEIFYFLISGAFAQSCFSLLQTIFKKEITRHL